VAITAISRSSKSLDLLLFLLGALRLRLLALLEISPAADPLLSTLVPGIVVLSLSLALGCLLVVLLLLASLLAHLRLHLPLLPHLVVADHPDGLLAPFLPEIFAPGLLVVGRELLLAHEQHACVGNALVELCAQFFVEEHALRFLEAVKGIGRKRVLGLVGMDEERLCAVDLLDVGLGDTGLEAEHCIGVEAEDVADSWDR
jgi:hypothetical protein